MTDNSNFRKQIGSVTGGGLKENLQVRLNVPPQQVQEGSFIVIDSQDWIFYGIATDLQLQAVDPRYALEPSRMRLPEHLAELLNRQTLYTNLVVLPALMLEQEPSDPQAQAVWRKAIDAGDKQEPRPLPVKSIPVHHADAFLASAGDVAEIFGKPDAEGNFVIGFTREQDHPVCVNLDKLIQRSSGIFGATGSGKSFLTRMLLAGLIDHNRASVLVYDMHNEYGLDDTASDTGENVRGLRSGFSAARVQVVGLGASATIRGSVPDFNLVLGYGDILPQDIELLTQELNLKETTPTVLDALKQSFGSEHWFEAFKEMKRGSFIESDDGKKVPAPDSVAYWANQCGVNQMAAEGLHDKLRRLFTRPYIIENPPTDSIQAIIEALKKGKHIVLSFGDFESDLDYLLISNLLTRRIREEWEKMTNEFRGKNGQEPRPLVIVVEEAHKLLNREMAAQTTFSTIAREMRKYYVTLLVIDQRPSQIYDEVMSQLGTRVCGWLGDEDDIHAVLSGLAGREALRGMLSRLQPKEEVLLLGWGVPMPILVRSRRYDEKFWKDIKASRKTGLDQEQVIRKLYPD
jgi:DNA helicase HerA-like ATPase